MKMDGIKIVLREMFCEWSEWSKNNDNLSALISSLMKLTVFFLEKNVACMKVDLHENYALI